MGRTNRVKTIPPLMLIDTIGHGTSFLFVLDVFD
jgi:hypothetical protein